MFFLPLRFPSSGWETRQKADLNMSDGMPVLWRCRMKRRENLPHWTLLRGIKDFRCTIMKSPTERASKRARSTLQKLILSRASSWTPFNSLSSPCKPPHRHHSSELLLKIHVKCEWSIWPNFRSDVNIFPPWWKAEWKASSCRALREVRELFWKLLSYELWRRLRVCTESSWE